MKAQFRNEFGLLVRCTLIFQISMALVVCRAALEFVGDAYVETSISQTSPNYTAAGPRNSNVTTGSSLGQLATITAGQSFFLGGQIQSYQPAVGTSATLFYRIGASGNYSQINLPYFQTAENNDWWDSSGAINFSHSYTSVDISSSLSSGFNTVDFYYEVNQNGTILDNASSSSPYSFTVDVVPEPANIALGIFGGLFGVIGLVCHLKKRSVTPNELCPVKLN